MGALMKRLRDNKGFSLVEILVTMVLMSLVMVAVYGLFLNSQRNSITSEEVVDVQQNLRIAYDTIARDIRMAGFSHPKSLASIGANQIEVYSASPFGRYARILKVDDASNNDITTIDRTNEGDTFVFHVPFEHAKALRQGHVFRLCRPQDGTYIPSENAGAGTYFVATGNPVRISASEYAIDLQLMAPAGETINFNKEPNGDLLARVMADTATPIYYYPYDDGSVAFPHVVAYELQDDPDSNDPDQRQLMRIVRRSDGSGILEQQVLAAKIKGANGLLFNYILKDNTVVAAAAVTDMDDVVGVQVKITGSTDVTQTGNAQMSGVKTREILGRVHIKNRTVTSGT